MVAGDRVLVKGAPDAMFPLCIATRGAADALHALASRGLRVLAVAERRLDGESLPDAADAAERGLELLGLIALEDPPRTGAGDAIATCRHAGIRVAMITGDHPATARAIAREVGLLRDDALVVVGKDLPDDDEALGALVDRDGLVVARVTPEDKLRIARALRLRGQVVAMTGDGVNDAPALREAAIGVAMGRSGTDVAREAADLVLLDDDFATVVAAVEQGRSTYANIRRFLTYHLTDNVAELAPFVVWALSGDRIPLALGVLQVLALDIGTDVLPALALGAEPPSGHALDEPPVRRHLLDRAVFLRAFGVLGPVEAFVEMTAFLMVFVAAGWRPGDAFPHGETLLAASGAAFTAVVLGQLATRSRAAARFVRSGRSDGRRTSCSWARSSPRSRCSRRSCTYRPSRTCSIRRLRPPSGSAWRGSPFPRSSPPTRSRRPCSGGGGVGRGGQHRHPRREPSTSSGNLRLGEPDGLFRGWRRRVHRVFGPGLTTPQE